MNEYTDEEINKAGDILRDCDPEKLAAWIRASEMSSTSIKCARCGVRWNAKPSNRSVCTDCERKLDREMK
jgi:hypothetical protein